MRNGISYARLFVYDLNTPKVLGLTFGIYGTILQREYLLDFKSVKKRLTDVLVLR